MKTDRYMKILLTIIAMCLLWICIRDIGLSPTKLYASPATLPEVVDVKIVGVDPFAFALVAPISVRVK